MAGGRVRGEDAEPPHRGRCGPFDPPSLLTRQAAGGLREKGVGKGRRSPRWDLGLFTESGVAAIDRGGWRWRRVQELAAIPNAMVGDRTVWRRDP